MSVRREGDCAVCGTRVEYVGYVPHIYLCLDCGFPDSHPSVKADKNGRAYIVKDDETTAKSNTDTKQEGSQ